jgi:drug/metabolite transporter (DMT)-like permease
MLDVPLDAPPVPRDRHERRGMLAAAGACTIWGASFLLTKVALAEMGAPEVVLWRFLTAVPFLLLVARRLRPARRHVPAFVLGGFIGVPLLFGLQVTGVAYTTATRAALVIGALPPLVAVGGALFLRERFTWRLGGALVLSSLGLVALVGGPTRGDYVLGDALVFASVVVSVAYVLVTGRIVRRYDPAGAAAWLQLAGTGCLVIGYVLWRGLPPLPEGAGTWAALLGLGAACTALANVLWNVGLRHLGAGRAGLFVNLEPVIGALLGVGLLGEPFSTGAAVGGALIFAAALLARGKKVGGR